MFRLESIELKGLGQFMLCVLGMNRSSVCEVESRANGNTPEVWVEKLVIETGKTAKDRGGRKKIKDVGERWEEREQEKQLVLAVMECFESWLQQKTEI